MKKSAIYLDEDAVKKKAAALAAVTNDEAAEIRDGLNGKIQYYAVYNPDQTLDASDSDASLGDQNDYDRACGQSEAARMW